MKIYRQLPERYSPVARAGLVALILLSMLANACTRGGGSWRESSRSSAGLAPLASEFNDPVVLAYRAKVWGIRGLVADHTWLATKEEGAADYTVYEVIGWRRFRDMPVVRVAQDMPDRRWFGATPIPMVDIRGPEAAGLIAKINDAVARYPYPESYSAFPGPNSNTFTAWVAHEVPELGLDLPLRAIGKNYPFDRQLDEAR